LDINFLKEIAIFTKIPVHEWAVLPVSAIPFSPELLDYCKTNACGNYNKSWVCPPACENFEKQKERILSYDNFIIFTTVHKLEDSFDYEGMMKGRENHTLLTRETKKRLGDTPVFGADTCPVCPSCSYPDPCPYPEKKIESIEAAGIDVTKISKIAKIKYNNGTCTVTFFSIILFNN